MNRRRASARSMLLPLRSVQKDRRIDGPATRIQLAAPHIIRKLCNAPWVGLPENVQVVNVIGFECSIGFQFPEPISVLSLRRKQVLGAILNGSFYALGPVFLAMARAPGQRAVPLRLARTTPCRLPYAKQPRLA